MKNLTITIVLTSVLCINGFAQLQQGKKFVGGTLSFYRLDNSGNKTTNLEIGPSLGFMISDHLSLGVMLDYSGQVVKGSTFRQSQNQFKLGIFSRQYFLLGDQFAIYLQENLNGSTGTEKYTDNNQPERKYNLSGFSIAAGPGIIFFPVLKLGLEAGIGSLGYDHQKRKDADSGSSDSTNIYGLHFNMNSFTFGVRYYF